MDPRIVPIEDQGCLVFVDGELLNPFEYGHDRASRTLTFVNELPPGTVVALVTVIGLFSSLVYTHYFRIKETIGPGSAVRYA
jgi:hypothetical protein